MTLTYYATDTSWGTGRIYYEDIEVALPAVIWSAVVGDFFEAEIDFGFDNFCLVCAWKPWIKITDLGLNYPFTSTPEVRYKIGTYYYVNGYDIVIDGEGYNALEYQSKPEFLIYERQALGEAWTAVFPNGDGFLDYAIVEADATILNLNAALHVPRQDFYSFQGLPNAQGININLNDGVKANLVVNYSWLPYYFSNSESRQKIVYSF